MKNHLKPHRNLESERQLKAIIQQIEALMYESENKHEVEKLLRKATKFYQSKGYEFGFGCNQTLRWLD